MRSSSEFNRLYAVLSLILLVACLRASAEGFALGAGPVATPSGKATHVGPIIAQASVSAPAKLPPNSSFTPPPANACQSSYDRHYEAEPGVYAYWALCETGAPPQIYDYAGQFDLTAASSSWGSGSIVGGAAGPVADAETAMSVSTASASIENQGIPLNTREGALAAWIDADATSYPVTAEYMGAVSGKSGVSIGVNTAATGLCFRGSYVNSAGVAATALRCGYAAGGWHRVVFTWSRGAAVLYVDGAEVAAAEYGGSLDNKVFYYKLFPGCCNTGKRMTLAKVSVSNQAWDAGQVESDFAPILPAIPPAGVYVSSQMLGEIHKDVLGYADNNQDISTPARRTALLAGLASGGLTSLRYAGGHGGIAADLADWQGGVSCTPTSSLTAQPGNLATADNIDNYLPHVAAPLGLDIVYTVNYGTNPPDCDAGGDPDRNGSSLVDYANQTKKYGVKRWEIGNEVYSSGSETDFHPAPNTGASYVAHEPAFYADMKAKDPTIQIAVPVGMSVYSWQSGFTLPVLAQAAYDAVVFHNYPMRDPIADGDTLYQDRVASHIGRVRGALLALQTELLSQGKDAGAIWVTEWDGEVAGDKWSKQTMGAVAPLFAASQLAEYMQAGVQAANWWEQGKPNGCSTLNYDGAGETAYSWWECGDTALVYAGPTAGAGEVAVGLQPGQLTPAGRAFQILSQSGFVAEGEHMLRTQTDPVNAPWLLSYAATHGQAYAVILINRDRDSAHTVPVAIAGEPSGESVRQWTYGRAQYDGSRTGNWSAGPVLTTAGAWSETFKATLPPWSVNVLVFEK